MRNTLAVAVAIGLLSASVSAQTVPGSGYYDVRAPEDFSGIPSSSGTFPILSGTTCPNVNFGGPPLMGPPQLTQQFILLFDHLVLLSPSRLTGYSSFPVGSNIRPSPSSANSAMLGGIGVVDMQISATTGNVVNGTDTWNFFYPPGITGTVDSVSGPFQLTITPIDANAFLGEISYTVPALQDINFANPQPGGSCTAHTQFAAKRTGPLSGAASQFAGIPGTSVCVSDTLTALGDLITAAKTLGFVSVMALQNAVRSFCRA